MKEFIKLIKLSNVFLIFLLNTNLIKSDIKPADGLIPMDYEPYPDYYHPSNIEGNNDYGYSDTHTSFMDYKNTNGYRDDNSKEYENNSSLNNLLDTKYCVGCNLNGSNLPSQNLNHVNISHSNAANINLKNASLDEAKAINTNLEYANLENLDARRSDFENSDLEHAYAPGANLSRSNLYNVTAKEIYAPKANLQKTNLARADLSKGNFRGANFKDAETFETDFEGSDRTGAIWTRGETCLDKDCKKTQGGEFYEEITTLNPEEGSKKTSPI